MQTDTHNSHLPPHELSIHCKKNPKWNRPPISNIKETGNRCPKGLTREHKRIANEQKLTNMHRILNLHTCNSLWRIASGKGKHDVLSRHFPGNDKKRGGSVFFAKSALCYWRFFVSCFSSVDVRFMMRFYMEKLGFIDFEESLSVFVSEDRRWKILTSFSVLTYRISWNS